MAQLQESRLRRSVGVFFGLTIVRIIVGIVCVTGGAMLIQSIVRLMVPSLSYELTGTQALIYVLGATVVAGGAVAGYLLYVRLIERRSGIELETKPAGEELAVGALAGAGLVSLTVGILWVVGAYRVDGLAGREELVYILAGALPAAIVSAVLEELVARGVLFRLTERSLGTWLALAISSLLFGLAHLANPHATIATALGLALQAGVLLGAAFLVTRRLWLPIGLHFGWNATQAAIFGGAVSGNEVHSLILARLAGPTWLSGGAFGIEGSVVATLLCALAGVALLVWAARTGRTIPLPLSHRGAETQTPRPLGGSPA